MMSPLLLRRLGALFVLLHLAACAATPSRHDDAPARHPVLLVSIDGLRADALGQGDTPVLDGLAREGVHAAWMRPSYPVLTFPNHFTLVTGLRPDRHGVVHNSMQDPELGRFLVANAATATITGWWQAEPLWVSAERAGIATAVWAWPGGTAAHGGVLPRYRQAFEAGVPLEARMARIAQWMLAPEGPRPGLVAVYLENVDSTGHDHGPHAGATRAAIRAVDAAIGRLLAQLQAGGVTPELVVVSDHGMADTPASQYIAVEDIASREEAEVVSIGQVIGLVPQPGHGQALHARLPGRHAHYQCWDKAAIPARLHYGGHPRVPPILCQMDEGWNALGRTTVERRKADGTLDRGAHGYDPELPSMRAVFLAHGPAFRRGVQLPPFDNVDLHPMLARLLGLQLPPGDGDPHTLSPALRAP